MSRSGLTSEIWWLCIYLGLWVVVGVSINALAEVLVLALSLYIIWLFVHIRALEHWLERTRISSAQENTFSGIWGQLAYDIRQICHRYEKDKSRLQTVVSRVQDMTSALGDGVVLLNKRQNIEWWNKAAGDLFDFRDSDLNHKITNIIRNPRFLEYFAKGDFDTPLDLNAARHSGLRLQFQLHPFGRGEHLLVVRDITRVYKLEKMRRDFVANVSHELRTPLTVIRGYVETFAQADNLPQNWEKPMSQMQSQGQRMTSLINDLIVLANLETDEIESDKQSVNLNLLIETIFSDARALSEDKNFDFVANLESSIIIMGNEKELRSAFSNLIFNAIRYSPEGGKISVETHSLGDQYIISVKDSGMGIDPKHIPRLTERFYRVDEGRSLESGGTGLGLAIVKHVLIRHGANLRISSELGMGSEFSCYFPKKFIHINQKLAS